MIWEVVNFFLTCFFCAKCGFLWQNYNTFFKKQKIEKLIVVPNNKVGSKQIAICLLVQMINTTKNCHICKWMRRPDSALHPLSICFVERVYVLLPPTRFLHDERPTFLFSSPLSTISHPVLSLCGVGQPKKLCLGGKKKLKQCPYVFSKVYGIHKTFQNKITTS